ncbi:MAG: AMP-binding protein, partial [Pseudomonadota bacterium]
MALTSQTASETPPGRPGTYARLTVGHTLERAAAEHGDRTAVVIGSHRLTNRQVLDEARTWAGRLAAAGVRPRDHVAILMPNCLEYLLLFYG